MKIVKFVVRKCFGAGIFGSAVYAADRSEVFALNDKAAGYFDVAQEKSCQFVSNYWPVVKIPFPICELGKSIRPVDASIKWFFYELNELPKRATRLLVHTINIPAKYALDYLIELENRKLAAVTATATATPQQNSDAVNRSVTKTD